MYKLLTNHVLAALVLVAPMAAFADTTLNLPSGSGVNLDTGKTGSSGGDITWTGTTVTFQGSATGVDLASTPIGGSFNGQTGYSQLVQLAKGGISTFATEFGSFLTTTAITPAVNDILVVKTNAGNYSAVLVNGIANGSISLEYTTFGGSTTGGGTSGGPQITGIANNYSFIPNGFPNSGITPSGIFTIFGSNMSQAPAGNITLNSSASPGIPTTSAGATVTITAGGTTYPAGIYYATPGQIAAVMPAKVPTGQATVTIGYNGQTSNAFQIQVVPAALGLDTYYGTGSGLVAAVNSSSGALYTYTNSAKPGDTILLYGSGLGADTADSDTVFTSSPHSVNPNVQVYFGGVAGTVGYAGSSGYPGLNQVNVTIPQNAPTGCYVGVVVTTGSGSSLTTSNYPSLAISPSGGDCTDSIFGNSGVTISTLSGQGTVRQGGAFIAQEIAPKSATDNTPVTSNIAIATFEQITGASFGSSSGNVFSIGSCSVDEVVNLSGSIPKIVGLDAGTINLTAPSGTFPLMGSPFAKGFYQAQLPDNAITSSGGAFTFNGSGGADVGSFSATINMPNPLLQWTNQSAGATVNRGSGVQVTWTGGAPGSYVVISGSSSNTTTGATGSFTCVANQSALQFSVPNYITGTLPAGSGTLSVANDASFSTFKATGIDYGYSFGSTSDAINSVYQ